MKVYKNGIVANADKIQLSALEAAGWSRTPEEDKSSEKKSVAKNKRKPVLKKQISKE